MKMNFLNTMILSFLVTIAIIFLFKQQQQFEAEIWAIEEACAKYSGIDNPRDIYNDQRERELYYECMTGGVE